MSIDALQHELMVQQVLACMHKRAKVNGNIGFTVCRGRIKKKSRHIFVEWNDNTYFYVGGTPDGAVFCHDPSGYWFFVLKSHVPILAELYRSQHERKK